MLIWEGDGDGEDSDNDNNINEADINKKII